MQHPAALCQLCCRDALSWGEHRRWDMGLCLMVSSPGKAQRPGNISQGDVDK